MIAELLVTVQVAFALPAECAIDESASRCFPIATLSTVVAMLTGNAGLDPLVRTNYLNPVNGLTANVPTVAVHGQWAGTDCTGQGVRSWLPWLRNAAADWTDSYGSGHWLG